MASEKKFKFNNVNEPTEDAVNAPQGQLGGSAGGGMGAAAPAKPTTPSGRPNVQQYMQANQGAGEKLAGNIQNSIQQDVNKVSRNVAQAKTDFGAKTNPLESNLGEQGSQKIQTAFKDPQALLNQQNQLDEFRKLQNNGYNEDISGVQQSTAENRNALQNQYGNLAQRTGQAGTEEGRFGLLRSSLGQPGYTRGQQKLDQLFLQSQPGVGRNLQKNLQGAQQQAQQSLTGFDAATQAKLSELGALSGDRQTQIQNLLKGGVAEGLDADINNRGFEDIKASSEQRLTDAQKRAQSAQGIQDRLANRQLSAPELASLGLASGQSTYDVNLNDYLKGTDYNPTLAGAASPEEFARYRALQQLAGDTSGDIYSGATAAGTYNPYNFDKQAATTALNARKNYYETERPAQLLQQYIAESANPRAGNDAAVVFNNQLRALQQNPTGDQWQGIQNAMNTYAQQNGFGSYEGSFNPEFEQIKNLRKRLISEKPEDLEDNNNFNVT